MQLSKWLMLIGIVLFNVANVVMWIHIRDQQGADGGAPRNAVPPQVSHAGHRHHEHHHAGRHHRGVKEVPATGTPLPSTPSQAPAEGVGKNLHPRKKRAGDLNLNDPDDMKPKETAIERLVLDPNVNRSFVSFIVIGDWGGPGHEPQREVARAMNKIAGGRLKDLLPSSNASFKSSSGVESTVVTPFVEAAPETGVGTRNQVDFIVSTGDNMYEDGVKNEFDHKFERNFEQVYTDPFIRPLRWYMALGNHDHGAHGVMRDVLGQIRYSQRSSRWFLPSTYYSQRFEVQVARPAKDFSIQLIVLDSYDTSPYMTRISKGQLSWFEQTLRESTADWKFVVGHRPIASAGAKHGSSPYLRTRLLPLMVKYGATAYLCGDDHELQVLEAEGVLFLLSGGGARAKSDLKKHGLNETVFQAGVHGFMTVSLTADALAVSVIDKAGHVLHRLKRSRKDALSR